jgi:hypothetical protein
MRILIAGASGAIGRPLVRRLRADQHEVFALPRSPDSTPLKEIEAKPVTADALDAVRRIQPGAVINELTSLSKHYTLAEMKQPRNGIAKSESKATLTCLATSRCGRAPLPAAKFKVPDSGTSPAPGPRMSRPVHLERVPRSRGQRSHIPGIGSTRLGDAGYRVRRATLRILLRSRHLVRVRAILVIRFGNSRFRLPVKDRASLASCISTMRPG